MYIVIYKMTTTTVSLKTGDWFVYMSIWKRWGNTIIKVIKRTPKMITLGVSDNDVSENNEMFFYDENSIELKTIRLKIRTFDTGSEYVIVPKTDTHSEYCLNFNYVMRFDTIKDMGRFIVGCHNKFPHTYIFLGRMKEEYDKVEMVVRIAKEKKAMREETVKCLVKKTILPVELKQLIVGWL